MNHPANNATAPAQTPAASLRQLTRDYSDGRITFSEYRRARTRLLDALASGDMAPLPYRPPPPPLAARIASQRNLSDTDPTLRIRRHSPLRRIWIMLLLVAVLFIAVVASVNS